MMTTEPSSLYEAHEIPIWLQTRYIHSGYRYNVNFLDCLNSLFYLHNESISIWTHLLPCLVFVGLAIGFAFNNSTSSSRKSKSDYDTTFLLARLCGSFATVFGASAFMHTFNPINEDWYLFTHRLDWAAIAFAIAGCGDSLTVMAYHNNPSRRKFWHFAFALSCAIFATIASTRTFHQSFPAWAKSCMALLPISVCVLFLWEIRNKAPQEHAKIRRVFGEPFLLCVVGILVYGAEFPEAYLTDIHFDMSRGHHLFHHFWSATCAFWFVWNTFQWSQQLNKHQF